MLQKEAVRALRGSGEGSGVKRTFAGVYPQIPSTVSFVRGGYWTDFVVFSVVVGLNIVIEAQLLCTAVLTIDN
jgi:hypothetical protein